MEKISQCYEWLEDLFNDFIKGVKNLIKWFPIVWRDRDWDDHYIFEILKFKITNQADYISKKDRHTLAQRDAQIMRTCVRLMERVQSEYYNTEYQDYVESKFDAVPSKDRPGSYEMNVTIVKENFGDYISKYPTAYRKVMLTDKEPLFPIRNSETLAMNIAYFNHNRARRILFTLLERNIERWWD